MASITYFYRFKLMVATYFELNRIFNETKKKNKKFRDFNPTRIV